MKRYFEQFFPDAPMQEITEQQARARTYYVLEQQAPCRYEHFSEGVLDEVIYSSCQDVSLVLADMRARYPDIKGRVYSPVTVDERATVFDLWYADAGAVTRHLRYVYQNDSDDYRIERYDADGALRKYEDYIHADWGLSEIKRYDGEGNLVGHEDVDP